MSWGVREWAVVGGPDWVVHLEPGREPELQETVERMLADGRSQLYLYFGGGVVAAPKPCQPARPATPAPTAYSYELSAMAGASIERGHLDKLLPWIADKLEHEGEAVVIADWRDLASYRAEQPVAALGHRQRPSALAG